MNNNPLIVAICGRPGSGKSSVQSTLERNFGIVPIDDGAVLRNHCIELFGMSVDDVTTQDGKNRVTRIQGVDWQNRKVIGEYGAILEDKFGDLTVPNWAIRHGLEKFDTRTAANANVRGISFGSVRRSQGRAYLQAGGVVIEIMRPGVEPTGNIWDEYDTSLVTYTYVNATRTLEQLDEDFSRFFDDVLKDIKGAKCA